MYNFRTVSPLASNTPTPTSGAPRSPGSLPARTSKRPRTQGKDEEKGKVGETQAGPVPDFSTPAPVQDLPMPVVASTDGSVQEELFPLTSDFGTWYKGRKLDASVGQSSQSELTMAPSTLEEFGIQSLLQVLESNEASKLDISGTPKAVISCFQKLGASFELEQVKSKADKRIYDMIDALREGKYEVNNALTGYIFL